MVDSKSGNNLPGNSNISDAIGMHPIHNECVFYS